MKAMLLSYFGGGAIAPYCYDVVSVLLADDPDAQARHARFVVFSGDCSSFEPNSEGSPLIEWLSPERLRLIVASKGSGSVPQSLSP